MSFLFSENVMFNSKLTKGFSLRITKPKPEAFSVPSLSCVDLTVENCVCVYL